MKYFIIIFCLFCVFTSTMQAKDSFGSMKVHEVSSIIDGDTFRVVINNVHPILGSRIAVRINGIDTPEMRSKNSTERKKARLAKQFVVEKLRTAKNIELKNIQRGKYFRIIADVYVDNANLGEELLQNGLAKRYY